MSHGYSKLYVKVEATTVGRFQDPRVENIPETQTIRAEVSRYVKSVVKRRRFTVLDYVLTVT